MHALRQFYASTLLMQGVSIKELAEFLGHSAPGFTLRTYTNLVPSSYERVRLAIDGVFAAGNWQDPTKVSNVAVGSRSLNLDR